MSKAGPAEARHSLSLGRRIPGPERVLLHGFLRRHRLWDRGRPVPGGRASYIGAMIRTVPAKTRNVVLVCGKCSKKLGGGFGKKGVRPLAKALREEGDGRKGRKSRLLVIETGCMKLCPKGAVVAINAARPEDWLLVPPRTDVDAVAMRLGLPPGERA